MRFCGFNINVIRLSKEDLSEAVPDLNYDFIFMREFWPNE